MVFYISLLIVLYDRIYSCIFELYIFRAIILVSLLSLLSSLLTFEMCLVAKPIATAQFSPTTTIAPLLVGIAFRATISLGRLCLGLWQRMWRLSVDRVCFVLFCLFVVAIYIIAFSWFFSLCALDFV
jgi:hypothetical protein